MSRDKRHYWAVEHIWRALRAIFILLGSYLWLETDVNNFIILGSYFAAVLVDQFHGFICNRIESILHYRPQHSNWE